MTSTMANELESTVGVLRDSQRHLARLAAENAQLRQQAVELRRRVAPSQHQRIIDRSREDAALLLHYRCSGIDCGRRWLNDTGVMSERRYGWALGLLRLARVDLVPVDIAHLDRCLRRLDSTVERLHSDGDILPLLARCKRSINRPR